MHNVGVDCQCGNTFETDVKAEIDTNRGEGGKWSNVTCPFCGEKYTIKLTFDYGHF